MKPAIQAAGVSFSEVVFAFGERPLGLALQSPGLTPDPLRRGDPRLGLRILPGGIDLLLELLFGLFAGGLAERAEARFGCRSKLLLTLGEAAVCLPL